MKFITLSNPIIARRKSMFRILMGLSIAVVCTEVSAKSSCHLVRAEKQIEKREYRAGLELLARCPADNSQAARWKGIAYHGLYQTDSALTYLKKAHDLGIRDDRVLINLAEVYLWKKNFREAARLTEQVKDRKNPELYKVQARNHEILGEFAEALKLYDKAIAVEKNPNETKSRKAIVHSWAKEYDKAVTLFGEIIASPKTLPEVKINCLIRRAEVLSWQKEYKSAFADLDKALKLDKQNSEALLLKAKILEWQGEYSSAKSIYSHILEFDADNDQAKMKLEKLEWVE